MTLTREQIEQWRGALKARYEEFPASIFSITNERICEEIDKLCDMALASLNVVPKPTEKTNDELRGLAELSTPGPWTVDRPNIDRESGLRNGVMIAATSPGQGIYADPPGGSFPAADRAYIAAANPQAIIALLDERDRLKEVVRKLAERIDITSQNWKGD